MDNVSSQNNNVDNVATLLSVEQHNWLQPRPKMLGLVLSTLLGRMDCQGYEQLKKSCIAMSI